MNRYRAFFLLVAFSMMTTACHDDVSKKPDIVVSEPPANTYTVTITSIDLVNKDNGESVSVAGLPVVGADLVVE